MGPGTGREMIRGDRLLPAGTIPLPASGPEGRRTGGP